MPESRQKKTNECHHFYLERREPLSIANEKKWHVQMKQQKQFGKLLSPNQKESVSILIKVFFCWQETAEKAS